MEIPLIDLLKHIEEFAGMLLTRDEIAAALEIDISLFQSRPEIESAFLQGKLQTEVSHKKKIIVLGNQGSSPAQQMVRKMVIDNKLKDIRDAWGY